MDAPLISHVARQRLTKNKQHSLASSGPYTNWWLGVWHRKVVFLQNLEVFFSLVFYTKLKFRAVLLDLKGSEDDAGKSEV